MVHVNPTIDENIQNFFCEQISKLPKKRGKQPTSDNSCSLRLTTRRKTISKKKLRKEADNKKL